MDKPAKPNTIANVLERIVKTFDTIGTGSAPIYTNTLFAQERQAVEEAEGLSQNKKRVELEELAKKEGAHGANPVKHTISYGSSTAPWSVVEALLRIQQQCQSALKPSEPLYRTNMAAAKSLHYLARR